MKLSAVITICFLSLLMLFSCSGSETEKTLRHADAVMEEYPDSALMLLELIEPDRLKGKSEKALYSLLLTQAMIKNGHIITNDSLISVAFSYFDEHGSIFNKIRTNFYLAKIAFYRNDYTAATDHASDAYYKAKSIPDIYWSAKTAELLGDIYAFSFNYSEAETFTSEAARLYLECGKIDNNRFSLSDLAVTYSNIGKTEQALSLLDSLSQVQDPLADPYDFIAYNNSCRLAILIRENRYSEAEDLIRYFDNPANRHKLNSNDITHLAVYFLYLRQPEKVEEYRQLLDSTGPTLINKTALWEALQFYYRREGDLQKALEYRDSLLTVVKNSDFSANPAVTAQTIKNYYKDESDKVQKEKNTQTVYYIVIVSFLATVAIAITFSRIKNHRLNQKKIRSLLAEIRNNETQIHNLDKELKEKKAFYEAREIGNETNNLTLQNDVIENKEFINILKERWRFLELMCEEYIDGTSDKGKDEKIVKRLSKEISLLKSNKSFSKLENEVNRNFDNILFKLKEDFKPFKTEDLRLLAYLLSGMSVRFISLMLELNPKTIYSRKSRLIGKILTLDTPRSELYKNILNGL